MRRFSIWDIIISVVALGVVCASLVPAVARLQRTPEDAKCQSNMRRFAEAIQLYSSEWDGRYPTNRLIATGVTSAQMPLSPRMYDENGNLIRFVYSINWVEALYPYMIDEAKKTGRDWESFLKCPKASNASQTATAAVTYTFNYNLLENYSNVIRTPEKLMMIREFDRLIDAVCRPGNNSTGKSTTAPISPFLTKYDAMLFRGQNLNSKMHGQGSHIMFADGHVKYFGEEFWPANNLSAQSNWDPETMQWWNWVNKSPSLDKQIAITP